MKNLFIVIVISLLPLTAAQAGAQDNLFGEVSLGYDTSAIAATNVVPPNENATTAGFGVTARGGYVLGPLIAGVSVYGTAGSLTYSSAALKNGYWNKAFTYVFAGLDFGRVRVWGDYGVLNQMRLATDYGTYTTDKIYSGGTCWKAGIGLGLSKRIHLNAEYFSNSPDAMSKSTGTVNFNATYSKFQETGYLFSIAYEIMGSEIHQR